MAWRRLKLEENSFDGELEGITSTQVEEDGFKYWEHSYHELGFPRYYSQTGDLPYLVVAVGSKKLRVQYRPNMRSGIPEGGILLIEEAPEDEPETPFKTKEPRYYDFQFFGQPYFIQGFWSFGADGKAAYPFFVSNSGWGDAGNENVFIMLDEEGIPCRAWMEASCH